jgi:hypothetical protein
LAWPASSSRFSGLDVAVVDLAGVQEVQGLGGVAHAAEQLRGGDAGQAGLAAGAEALPQVAVGQLQHGDEAVGQREEGVQRQQVGVPQPLDQPQRLQLALGLGGLEVAGDDLDRDLDAAGRLGAPDLAEGAAAEERDGAVAGRQLRRRQHGGGHHGAASAGGWASPHCGPRDAATQGPPLRKCEHGGARDTFLVRRRVRSARRGPSPRAAQT